MRPEPDNLVNRGREPASSLRCLIQAAALLGAFAFLMFLTSPINGDFAWSDALRPGLNGVFLRDFLIAMPWQDPMARR